MEDSGGNEKAVPPLAMELKKDEILTEEMKLTIMKNLSKPDWELVDFDVKPGTVIGDNYMSIIYAVNLHLKNSGTGEAEMVSVMLKVLPRNEIRLKMITDGNIFKRDVYFYETIAPAMEKFQIDLGIGEEEMVCYWPKCFACKTDGKGDYLAMEDLKLLGYKMADRKMGLDFDHCKLVLEAQARFHAVSYAMFGGDFDAILRKYPWLEEKMFKEEILPQGMREMMEHTYSTIANMMRASGEDGAAANVEKVFNKEYFSVLYNLAGNKVDWAVIGHGDCWTNNLMFLYDEETKKPVSVKFVDFQITRCSSRAVDIHYFLYTSPQIDVLNEKEGELMENYFNEFTRFVKLLGVDVDGHKLTKQNFKNEISQFRYYGCTAGLIISIMTSADSEDIPVMEDLKEEDLTSDESKNFFLKLLKEMAMKKLTNISKVHLPKCPQLYQQQA